MGGRGASGTLANSNGKRKNRGQKVEGISVEINGTQIEYQMINGKIYNVSGITPTEVQTGDKTIEELAKRISHNTDAVVTNMTSKDIKRREEKREEYRKEMDNFLDLAYVRDKHFVKGSRAERIRNRANKRKK